MITSDQLEKMADILKLKALKGSLTEPDTLFSLAAATLHTAMILCDIRTELAEIKEVLHVHLR